MAENFDKDFTNQNENFDMYGVWIKQKPQTPDSQVLDLDDLDEASETFNQSPEPEHQTEPDNKITESLDTSSDETFVLDDDITIDDVEEEVDTDMQTDNFESFEIDDFLSDDSPVTENEESDAKPKKEEPDENGFVAVDFDVDDLISSDEKKDDNDELEPVEMDIEFDDSFAKEQEKEQDSTDAFDDMLDELTGVSSTSTETTTIEDESENSTENDNINADIEIDMSTAMDTPVVEEETETTSFSQISFDDLADDEEDEKEKSKPQSVSETTVEAKEEPEKDGGFEEISLDDFAFDEVDVDDLTASDSTQTQHQEKPKQNENIDLKISVDDESGVDTMQEIARGTANEISNLSLTSDEEIIEKKTITNNDIAESELNTEVPEPTSDELYFDDVNAVTDDLLEQTTDDITKQQNFTVQEEANMEFEDEASKITDMDVPMNSIIDNNLSESDKPVADNNVAMTNDKSTELLMQIANEISSIKTELSDLKKEFASHISDKSAIIPDTEDIFADDNIDEELSSESMFADNDELLDIESDTANVEDLVDDNEDDNATGFFTDDDNDETISLTGDELSNILITADFTEEPANEEYEIPEVLNLDETYDSPPKNAIDEENNDKPEIDGIKIEPEHITPQPGDMTYLDESETSEPDMDFDNSTVEIPVFDEDLPIADEDLEISTEEFITPEDDNNEISVSEIDDISDDLPVLDLDINNVDEDFAETAEEKLSTVEDKAINKNLGQTSQADMSVELKEEIKSVLSYMDQLLESLPEDKIEEFARSEHFSTYKKLFEDLGIS
ncbi:MAG: hypothetical protein CR988_03985 [Treponema sp.]|nr:MAG: hypothetical protein CR988_03985 [Treponema sp.]